VRKLFHLWSGRRLALMLACGLFLPTLWGCFGPPPGPMVSDGDSAVGRPIDAVDGSVPDLPTEPPMEEAIRPVDEDLGTDQGSDPVVSEPAGVEGADLTDDGVIDENDIDAFAGLFGSSSGADAAEFNPAADFDGDGSITLVDFQMFLDLLAAGPQE